MKLGIMHQLMVILDILLGAVEDRNVVEMMKCIVLRNNNNSRERDVCCNFPYPTEVTVKQNIPIHDEWYCSSRASHGHILSMQLQQRIGKTKPDTTVDLLED